MISRLGRTGHRAPKVHLEPVKTPQIAGATLHRHPLEREAARVMKLLQLVGRRLNRWFRDMPELQASQYAIRTENGLVFTTRLDEAGNAIMEPVVPGRDMVDTAKWYSDTLLGMLLEQRQRAAMKSGRPDMTDEEARVELDELIAEAIETMPKEQLKRLLAARPIDAAEGAEGSPPPPAEVPGSSLADAGDPAREPEPEVAAEPASDDPFGFGDAE